MLFRSTYVEIKNLDNHDIVVGGWRFDQGLNLIFPSGLTLPVNGYAVFAEFKSLVDSFYHIQSIDYDNSTLSNSGENIAITNSLGQLIDSVHYDIVAPWDTLANGYGASLVLCDESSDNDDPANWSAATNVQGAWNNTVITGNPMNNCTMSAGINDIINPMFVEVFPNPSNGIITINAIENSFSYVDILITDITGKNVYENSHASLPARINLSNEEKGVFFVSCTGKTTNRAVLIVQ